MSGTLTGRIAITQVEPSTPNGFAAKASLDEPVEVRAVIFADGHDHLAARARLEPGGEWQALTHLGNDHWRASLPPLNQVGPHRLTVEAWVDRYDTWAHGAEVKLEAGLDIELELEEGARILDRLGAGEAAAKVRRTSCKQPVRLAEGLAARPLVDGVPDVDSLTRHDPLPVWVDRAVARTGAWYELFPRSYGGFRQTADTQLERVAGMGFDVLYLPPIHPIGTTARKGPNNTLHAGPNDTGSPWAIGGPEGGHTTVHPDLGTIDDFDHLVTRARAHDLEVALDYALQCSPDHPWVDKHPEWFTVRPDGSIATAENPPKKYQDIHPINFWPADDADREALWDACAEVLEFWIDHGVRIFRVDNPHTKPLAFWHWVIERIHRADPGVVFLAEAFTRPAMMAALGEIGFSQSYTYFTWRTTADELGDYVTELARPSTADVMRPNFWPNTPDILSGPLRDGPPAAFRMRALLAATLSPSFGIYSGYEVYENVPMSERNEEYFESEKYQLKSRDFDDPDSLAPFLATLNAIRKTHPCLQFLRGDGVRVLERDGADELFAYSRHHGDDHLLVVANLDPHGPQEGSIGFDPTWFGLSTDRPMTAHDLLSGERYDWQGGRQYVRLQPGDAHVFVLES